MLNFSPIEYILSSLNDFVENEHTKLQASIVTNGALLNAKMVTQLMELGVSLAMITIDGTQEMHDQRRPFLNGSGSFNLVWNNLRNAMQHGLKVQLNINVDGENDHIIPQLLEKLDSSDLDRSRLDVHFSKVVQAITPTKHCLTYEMPLRDFGKSLIQHTKIACEKGFLSGGGLLSGGVCMMKTDNTFVIDPHGDIYKCISGVGYDAFKAGSIFDDTRDVSWALSQFVAAEPWKSNKGCTKCRYLPLCLGGCPEQLFVRAGSWEGIDCQKPKLAFLIPKAMKLFYTQSQSNPSK